MPVNAAKESFDITGRRRDDMTEREKGVCLIVAQWVESIRNRRVEYWDIRFLAHSYACTLAFHRSLCSCVPLSLFICSIAQSIVPEIYVYEKWNNQAEKNPKNKDESYGSFHY